MQNAGARLFDPDQFTRDVSSLDLHARIAAAHRAGRFRAEAATLELMRMLRSDELEARAAAASALGRIGDPRAMAVLIEAIHDEDFAVRSAAGWALVALGEVAIDPVAWIARAGDNADAAEMAMLVLERIPSGMARLRG